MKLAIYSDLHIEHSFFEVPEGFGADVVVLAGDIHVPGHATPKWARRPYGFRDTPVVYVAGNHEFYGSEYGSQKRRMAEECARRGVRYLDAGSTVIDDVRFIGCTLWTDFALGIVQPDGSLRSEPPYSMWMSGKYMNDYACIRFDQPTTSPKTPMRRSLRPADTLAMHQAERAWLEAELARPFGGPTVVVTHHAPHRNSLAKEYEMDEMSGAFVSELPASFFNVPVLWVHGHTHHSFDYRVGNCRVVCNPRGYPTRYRNGHENEAFDRMGLGIELVQDAGSGEWRC
jgi:predicted phosphodiesterase